MLKNMPSAKVMQTFESAARLESFTLAAKELFLTQSAISRQIKSLEETLEFDVFIRENNRLILTEDGHIFYEVVSKALSELSATVDHLRQKEVEPRLRLLVPPTFSSRWLAPRLPDFRRICSSPLTLTNHQNLSYSPNGDFDCQVAFGGDELQAMGGTMLFPEAIVPACTPALKEQIVSSGGTQGIPLLHTLDNNRRLPYWEVWLDRHSDTIINPAAVEIATGIEFSTQDQTIIAAVSGLGIVMLDINIAQHVLSQGFLVPLGDPVNTVYGYWISRPGNGKKRNKNARLLYNWIRKQAKECLHG